MADRRRRAGAGGSRSALIISRMVPSFRLMQEPHRRGQPAAARADHRRPRRPRLRARAARDPAVRRRPTSDLTEVAVRAGRWLAAMFPIVMLVANVASVAVLWFGGHRVESGQMEVGALTAYLAYLMQIVMSVMMGTFMMMMIPRSAVCADRIVEVLDTDSSVVPSGRPRRRADRARRPRPRGRRASATPAPRRRCCARSRSLPAPARPSRSSARPAPARPPWSTSCPGSSTPPGGRVLVDGVDVRDLEPDVLWSRLGLVPQQAFLFSGTVAANLRHGKPDATDEEIWEALRDRPGRGLRARHARGAGRRRSPRAAPT